MLLPICVTIPNLIAQGQAVWASVLSQKFENAGPRPLRKGMCLTPRNTLLPTYAAMQNLVALIQPCAA